MSWVAHYLDDFVTVGPPESPECQTKLKIMLATCQRVGVGVPVAQEKCAGPAAVLVFLGFELDTNPTGDRCLWLLGLRSSLGFMVVAVEMGRSIDRVAYLSKGASPNSLCGSGMGRALGGTASAVPL